MEPVPRIERAMPRVTDFAGMVCGDQDLLRAEFNAIIAANWPSHDQPTPTGPTPGSVARSNPTGPGSECFPIGGQIRRPTPLVPVTAWPRERSPPIPHWWVIDSPRRVSGTTVAPVESADHGRWPRLVPRSVSPRRQEHRRRVSRPAPRPQAHHPAGPAQATGRGSHAPSTPQQLHADPPRKRTGRNHTQPA